LTQETPAYLLIDGENIDMTLGSILANRPRPEQRPRWERVIRFVESHWQKPARGLFFLNASRGLPWPFIAALKSIGIVPIPLEGSSDQKIVDIAILRTLEALATRPGDVMLVSHDHDFAQAMSALVGGGRKLGVLAFAEFMAAELRDLPGLEVLDLEYNAGAFDGAPLPRVRAIPIEEFDPLRYL